MMLHDYLVKNCKVREPIFTSDVGPSVLVPMVDELCDDGKLRRFDEGIYYLPATTRLQGFSSIAPEIVAECKHVARRGNVFGFYPWFTFANQIGVTTQIPYVL